MTAARSAGSSLSQPSEAITSTPPRTALPCRDTSSSRRQVARWVPPNRSVTCSLASATASCGRLVRERRGQPGQRGREGERLGPAGPCERPHQVQVDGGVALHRLADVAQERDGQGAAHRVVALELHRLPAGSPRGGDRLAQRDPVARPVAPAAAAAPGRPARRGLLQPPTEHRQLRLVERVERGVGDPGHRARQQLGQRLLAAVLVVVRRGPRQGVPRQVRGDLAARRLRPAPGRGRRRVDSASTAVLRACGSTGEHRVAEDRLEDGVEHRQVVLAVDQGEPGQPVERVHLRRRRDVERLREGRHRPQA